MERNDPAQYDTLADSWWDPAGPLVLLRMIADARTRLLPPAQRIGDVLLDLGCGGGLMAPRVSALGYRHVGIDLRSRALQVARDHGALAVQGDVLRLPLPDACVDTVVAGEILEHVTDLGAAVAEIGRVLRPGGLLVLDTLADTRLCRLVAIWLAERLPGGAPRGLHDPALLVNRERLRQLCRREGIELRLQGLFPAPIPALHWMLVRHRRPAERVPTPQLRSVRSTAVLFQAAGRKGMPS